MVLCRNMEILSAPRVGCQIYYVPVKVRRPSSRYIKKKEYRKKRKKRGRWRGWVKRGGVGISTDSSAVGDCSPQESILEIQRARAHLTKTRPHMKKLLRGGRALGSAPECPEYAECPECLDNSGVPVTPLVGSLSS